VFTLIPQQATLIIGVSVSIVSLFVLVAFHKYYFWKHEDTIITWELYVLNEQVK
jgi:hypothetical protein